MWYSCNVRTSIHPSNTGNPLTSASQLCCGRTSVCTFLRHRSCVHVPESDWAFQEGGEGVQYSRTTHRSLKGHKQEKLKQTQPLPFSQDTFRHFYWLTRAGALFFHSSSCLPLSAFLFKEFWRFDLWTLTPLEKLKLSKGTWFETRVLALSWFRSLSFFNSVLFDWFVEWHSVAACHPDEWQTCTHSLTANSTACKSHFSIHFHSLSRLLLLYYIRGRNLKIPKFSTWLDPVKG